MSIKSKLAYWKELTPLCFQNYVNPYSEEWDVKLNQWLDKYELKNPRRGSTYFVAELNGHALWVGNYPYSYGYPYLPKQIAVRPSRKTILRLRKAEKKLYAQKTLAEQILELPD